MESEKFPECIQQRITNDFLLTFKEGLEEIFIDELPEHPTYWNYYQWYDSSDGFYNALKIACAKHDLIDLYEYLQEIGDYFNDELAGSITEMLYQHGLIEEGTPEEAYPIPFETFKLLDDVI